MKEAQNGAETKGKGNKSVIDNIINANIGR